MFRAKRRFLSLLEYQAKSLLSLNGVNTQKFQIISEQEVEQETDGISPCDKGASSIASKLIVVKAQVACGGRGKGYFAEDPKIGGGIQLVETLEEAKLISKKMLSKHLITAQTDSRGEMVRQVMIAEAVPEILSEGYLAILISPHGPKIVCSPNGGVDIESVPRDEIYEFNQSDYEQIVLKVFPKYSTDQSFLCEAKRQLESLITIFNDTDALQIEINPWGVVKNGRGQITTMCIDSKIELDDNAAYRQKEIFQALQTQHHPSDNHVEMEGNLACVVNGAGLAMATMDLVSILGGKPANFLDLGGRANSESISQAIRNVFNPKVKSIFVNVFGGIVRCDHVAQGLLANNVKVPVIVRLNGNNYREAQSLLQDHPFITLEPDLFKAAVKAVNKSKEQTQKKMMTNNH